MERVPPAARLTSRRAGRSLGSGHQTGGAGTGGAGSAGRRRRPAEPRQVRRWRRQRGDAKRDQRAYRHARRHDLLAPAPAVIGFQRLAALLRRTRQAASRLLGHPLAELAREIGHHVDEQGIVGRRFVAAGAKRQTLRHQTLYAVAQHDRTSSSAADTTPDQHTA